MLDLIFFVLIVLALAKLVDALETPEERRDAERVRRQNRRDDMNDYIRAQNKRLKEQAREWRRRK